MTIADDGRGIDTDAVTDKAMDLGVARYESLQRMSEDEQLGLVFHEGLSGGTQESVNSGRGVEISMMTKASGSVAGEWKIASAVKGANFPYGFLCPPRCGASQSKAPCKNCLV